MVTDERTDPPRRFLDGLFALPLFRLALWLAVFATFFAGVFTDPGKTLLFMDDHQFVNWEESDRLSIMEYHQFPLWNPWYCGGVVSTASPESAVYSPDFLLRLAFGVLNGRRIAIVLLMVLGMEGFYQLSRKLGSSAVASAFVATVATTFTTTMSFLGSGWINFLGFELIPWVLLGLIKGRESVAWRLVGAMALGWIVLNAGTYSAPYTGIAVVILTVGLCITSLMPLRVNELRGTVLSAATVAVGGGVLAAAKLVPMMLLMRQFPRVFTPAEVHEPMGLLGGYWPLYSVVLILALFALFFRDVWARLFFATAVLFFVCAMGQFADYAPGTIMRKLPLVSGLRLPERFMVMFHIFATLTAARGLTHLEDVFTRTLRGLWGMLRKPANQRPLEGLLVPVLCSIAAAGVIFYFLRPIATPMIGAARSPAHVLFTFEGPLRVEQDFRQARGNRRDSHIFPFANRGTLYCLLAITLPESTKLRADLPEEEYPSDPSVAKVKRVSWSPHEIKLHVEASAPTRIFVNQNYHANWSTDVGTIVNDEKLLGIDVPQGAYDLTLTFHDRVAVAAFLFSLAALCGMLGYLGRLGLASGKEAVARYRELLGVPVDPAPAPAAATAEEPEPEEEDEAKPEEAAAEEPKDEPKDEA